MSSNESVEDTCYGREQEITRQLSFLHIPSIQFFSRVLSSAECVSCGVECNKCLLVCRDVPQALPLIGLHRQPCQGLHAAVDPHTVTHQHIHYPLERERKEKHFYLEANRV